MIGFNATVVRAVTVASREMNKRGSIHDSYPVQTGSGAHAVSCPVVCEHFLWELCGRSLKLTTQPRQDQPLKCAASSRLNSMKIKALAVKTTKLTSKIITSHRCIFDFQCRTYHRRQGHTWGNLLTKQRSCSSQNKVSIVLWLPHFTYSSYILFALRSSQRWHFSHVGFNKEEGKPDSA
jgi:hypothetical protein